jgi:hypothetical protein
VSSTTRSRRTSTVPTNYATCNTGCAHCAGQHESAVSRPTAQRDCRRQSRRPHEPVQERLDGVGGVQRARRRRELRVLRVSGADQRAGHDDQQHAQAAQRARELHVHADLRKSRSTSTSASPATAYDLPRNDQDTYGYYVESAFGSPRTVVQGADGKSTAGTLLGGVSLESMSSIITRSNSLRAIPSTQLRYTPLPGSRTASR